MVRINSLTQCIIHPISIVSDLFVHNFTLHVGLGQTKSISAIALNPFINNVIIAASHDKSLLQIDIQNNKLITDPIQMESFINALCWQPKSHEHLEEGLHLIAACSDGSLVFFSQTRVGPIYSLRVKKTVQAHEGSVTSIKWSFDGSNLASVGEDGDVKVWTQTGHLKSTIGRFDSCVNCMDWNYECNSLVAAHDDILTILPFQHQHQRDIVEWKVSQNDARRGVILVVVWNNALDLILSGGEDCIYRVFDSTGVCLFMSQQLTHPITSAVWMLNGEGFAIGSYSTIHFCDKAGLWSNCYKIEGSSSVQDMHYEEESSKFIAGCCSGEIISADIIGKVVEWNGISVEHAENDHLQLSFSKRSFSNDTLEVVSIPE